MKKWFNEEIGKMLTQARQRAGYQPDQVSAYLGFDIDFVEKGLVSLGMCDVICLARASSEIGTSFHS